jgi:hypothetical protein
MSSRKDFMRAVGVGMVVTFRRDIAVAAGSMPVHGAAPSRATPQRQRRVAACIIISPTLSLSLSLTLSRALFLGAALPRPPTTAL